MDERIRKRSEADIYHVVCRGVGRQIIFEDDRDREGLRNLLAIETARSPVSIMAWCFMDNHIHLLLRAELEEISAVMKRILSVYATGFNERHDRVGHLFQGRFRSEPVEADSYFLSAIRYIHKNPEHAGIAPTGSYRWSSYREYIDRPKITDTSLALDMFGSVDEFVSFHRGEGPDCFLEENDGRGEAAAKRALRIAIDELGERELFRVKALSSEGRKTSIARLRDRGLTIRQIERFTGISRGSIENLFRS